MWSKVIIPLPGIELRHTESERSPSERQRGCQATKGDNAWINESVSVISKKCWGLFLPSGILSVILKLVMWTMRMLLLRVHPQRNLCVGATNRLLFARIRMSIQDKNGYAWCTANSVPRESGQDQDPGSVSQACQQLHLEWHFSAVWISMSLVGDGSEHLFMWILTNLHLLFLHGYEVSIHIAPSFLKFNFCFLLLVWRDL